MYYTRFCLKKVRIFLPFFLCFLLVAVFKISAQQRFNRIYNVMTSSNGDTLLFAFSNLAVYGNCFISTAAIVDTTTISNSATYSLILLDSAGNILWKKHYVFNKESVIFDIIPKTLINSGNNFYMLRTNVDYVADSIFPVVIKFNAKSKIINEYRLSNINFAFMGGSAHLINFSENTSFAAVSARIDINIPSSIYIYKLDTNIYLPKQLRC